MQLIDDEGFVLGRINIVDILVVLLVVAMVIAGVAFLTTGDGEQPTRTVMLTAGEQPS